MSRDGSQASCALGCGSSSPTATSPADCWRGREPLLRTTLHIVRKLADQRGLLAVPDAGGRSRAPSPGWPRTVAWT